MNRQEIDNCDRHEELVTYLYGESTPEEVTRFEAHLTECAACNEELSGFGRVRETLQHWEIAPPASLRIRVPVERKRGLGAMAAAFRDLFLVTPIWAKACGGAAAALVVLAIAGAQVSIDHGRMSFSASVFGVGRHDINGQRVATNGAPNQASAAPVLTRQEVQTIVNQAVLQSEMRQKEDLTAKLALMEADFKSSRSTDLSKLAARIEMEREQIAAIEHDMDLRAGLGLPEVFLSERSRVDTGAEEGR